MNIAVLGLGYVGCVTACCLARSGHRVIGVDISPEKVRLVNDGQSPIVEPGLGALLAEVVAAGRLSATESVADAIAVSEIALICVGTPGVGLGQQDLGALTRVSASIKQACAGRREPLTVVLRSTVLPGTTARVLAELLDDSSLNEFVTVATNPEFMREGSSIEDFDHPPFIVVGSDDPKGVETLRRMYADVEAPFVATSVRNAEMVKYVCNAFHALKICFANEVADICDALGTDAQDVMRIFMQDRKLNISTAYLRPGFAFGGSCLPKDVRALAHVGRALDVPVPLLDAIVPSNDGQVRRAIDQILQTRKKRIGIVGLAFKSTTDDLRESPIVSVVEALIGKGCDVRIYDTNVVMARLRGANRRYIETEIPHISALLCDQADALVAHSELIVFGSLGEDADRVRAVMPEGQTVIDLTRTGFGTTALKPPSRTQTGGVAAALSGKN